MIADLKPYPSMNRSGVKWLGEVPDHWDVLPNRALFDEVKDRDHPDEEMLSITIKRGVIKQASLLQDTSMKDSSNLDRSNYKLVRPGDVAYNKMRAWQGAVGVSEHRGIVSPAYVIERPRADNLPKYFHYLFRIPAFAKEAERWSYGITSDMWSLRPEHFKLIYSCRPPLNEQKAIVRYLDHVDRRFRRLIRAKRKLIALLEEQKKAVVHRAVTGGLDRNVRLKDSGIDWLGKVPVHWDVKPIRSFCPYISYGFTNPMPVTDDGPYMLTANDIGEGAIRYSTARRTTRIAFDTLLTRKSKPISGDILITKDGSLGRVAVADGTPACINQSVALLRPDPREVLPDYLSAALRGPLYQERMVFEAGGTTIKHIYITRLAKMRMSYPSIDEQKAILASLADEVTEIESAVDSASKEVALLSEYRSRLFADVVTGKFDVRDAAAALPETDPSAGIDDLEVSLDGPLDDMQEVSEGADA